MSSPSSQVWKNWLLYFLVPVGVHMFTSLPGVNLFTPVLVIIVVALVLGARLVVTLPRWLHILLWTLVVLLLVGSSGWFFSPFFFALYLMAIALGFLYTIGVSISFTLALVILFASSIGEVNPVADFLTLLSLLSVIPITIALRKSFLLVQQEKRGILILETDAASSAVTSLDAILSNQINKIAILIRQPITYVRQGLALLNEKKLSQTESEEVISRMTKAADEVFTLIKEFESDTTNNPLLGRSATGREVKKP